MTQPWEYDVHAGRPSPTAAVIGSGVAGLTAAYVLARTHRVTLFEADERLGGHADTHRVELPDGRELHVDTGFIVHNDRTYPTLLRLFGELGIATWDTDMSMSVSNESSGLEYAGALGVRGLFPVPFNLVRPSYLRMLADVTRFHRVARRVLYDGGDDETLAAFVARHRFSRYFQDNFLLPLVAAVWSCDERTAADYPARYLFTFLDHHGMLSVFGSPTWRTVTGGSKTYVDAIARRIRDDGDVWTSTPVHSVRENDDGVEVTSARGTQFVDRAVIATHPHQALRILADATPMQRAVLGAIDYLPKDAVLHTDESVLPRARQARASWNYRIPAGDGAAGDIVVTYDLTRLMRLPEGDGAPRMLVTMGRIDLVDPSTVIDRMRYEHPVYTLDAVAAQQRLSRIGTDRIAFAGAYHGWGFHEDGAASGAAAAARLGAAWTGDEVSV
ncbi:MAG: FAD-dependent oxidoreductase [Gordonia sp. (in: high G+C Gram-positive bacteria)]|uniref:NAD(P)/FAD-dependent oxidoreductase n=1 Tax=Gordonia sp. (in: high G+C Gram-positive bacteria) TaxID=84139 RepID=UPI0039E5F84E